MANLMLFLASCALIALFAWYFFWLGQQALTAWIALLGLLANLFVLKQIELMGLNATASDIFAVGNLLALNLLQEQFGREAARKAIWTSFSCLVFFVIMSQIHLAYTPSSYDETQPLYAALLGSSPRILLASLTTFLIIDQFDSKLYRLLRKTYPRLPMLLASGCTMCISQFLDNVMFSLLGLYGIVSALLEIIIVSYSIKLMVIAAIIPWSFLTRSLFNKCTKHEKYV